MHDKQSVWSGPEQVKHSELQSTQFVPTKIFPYIHSIQSVAWVPRHFLHTELQIVHNLVESSAKYFTGQFDELTHYLNKWFPYHPIKHVARQTLIVECANDP